jgi:hypothetical protein
MCPLTLSRSDKSCQTPRACTVREVDYCCRKRKMYHQRETDLRVVVVRAFELHLSCEYKFDRLAFSWRIRRCAERCKTEQATIEETRDRSLAVEGGGRGRGRGRDVGRGSIVVQRRSKRVRNRVLRLLARRDVREFYDYAGSLRRSEAIGEIGEIRGGYENVSCVFVRCNVRCAGGHTIGIDIVGCYEPIVRSRLAEMLQERTCSRFPLRAGQRRLTPTCRILVAGG